MRGYSLRNRVLLTQTLVLVAFFAVTILALDQAFRHTAERAIRDRLEVQIYGLLAAAEQLDDGTLSLPDSLPDRRFENPSSGLYARVDDGEGEVLWRSPSAVGLDMVPPPDTRLGQLAFADHAWLGSGLFVAALAVDWEDLDGESRTFTFMVAEDQAGYHQQVARWRQQLLAWFGVAMAALTLVLMASLRFMLSPLQQVEEEIAEVERGERSALSEDLPEELRGVSSSLNTLVRNERLRLSRYRESLGNLAHSLKTPLAAMRAILRGEADEVERRHRLEAQVSRVDEIVGYQLRRAAAAGGTSLGHAASPIAPRATEVAAALERVYPACDIRLTVDETLAYRADQGDILEILGNLLENACKYGGGQVHLTVEADEDALLLSVDDDGPGIPRERFETMLERGRRLDERTSGQGIGLSVVAEIVTLYGGRLECAGSPQGGARIQVRLPGVARV